MGRTKWLEAAGVLLLGLVTTTSGRAQAPSFTVPYANPFSPSSLLKIKLNFNAGPGTLFVVDTGSVGIVVPKTELPTTVTKAADGQIQYTSSGLVVDGFWTDPIDIHLDLSGAIAHVSVFAATDSHCHPHSSNPCKPGSLPHMMGVGFGRPDSYASSDRNPLLHIRNMPSGRPSNYRLTHAGIELGLANPSAIKGMHLMQLTPWTRPGLHHLRVTDYKTPTGSIGINGHSPLQASILIDTGITDSLIALASGEPAECIAPPPKPGANCVIANGTHIALALLSGKVAFAFTLGDQAAATPDSGHWVHLNSQEGSFINTGKSLLAKFDVFFDSTSGTFGLNPASL